jgi:hypothetical protein
VTGGRPGALLRIGGRRVRFDAEGALLGVVLGPLAALEEEGDGPADVLVRAEVDASAVPTGPATGTASDVSWVPDSKRPAVVARGLGRAEVPEDEALLVRMRPDPPRGDAVAEGLTIPALAERLRRDGVRLLHAAVLVPATTSPRRAWLVPASRGGGKTTLSLSLRGRGFLLLSDDRCFLFGPVDDPRVDPWPEAPRVGDRSLFLLPPHVVPGARDPRTGKSPVPGLTPPRVRDPLPIAGFLVPRLVDGPGGDVSPLSGSAALASIIPHAVLATDPATASQSLAWVASLLHSLPAFEATVGDDPAALAEHLGQTPFFSP